MIGEYGAISGIIIGRGNRSVRIRSSLTSLCSPQIPYYPTWNWTQADKFEADEYLANFITKLNVTELISGSGTAHFFLCNFIFCVLLCPSSYLWIEVGTDDSVKSLGICLWQKEKPHAEVCAKYLVQIIIGHHCGLRKASCRENETSYYARKHGMCYWMTIG